MGAVHARPSDVNLRFVFINDKWPDINMETNLFCCSSVVPCRNELVEQESAHGFRRAFDHIPGHSQEQLKNFKLSKCLCISLSQC